MERPEDYFIKEGKYLDIRIEIDPDKVEEVVKTLMVTMNKDRELIDGAKISTIYFHSTDIEEKAIQARTILEEALNKLNKLGIEDSKGLTNNIR